MLPPPEKFSSRMRAMGIGDGQRIVVYDRQGVFSAPRVWWTFRVMGAEDVSVLNGGLPKWKSEGRPLMMAAPNPRTRRHFTTRHNLDLVRDVDDIKAVIKDGSATVLDARSPERFAGQTPEPREGLRAGHIPGARNVPYGQLINSDGTLKSREGPSDDLRGSGCRSASAGGHELRLRHHGLRFGIGTGGGRAPGGRRSTMALGPNGVPTKACRSRPVSRTWAKTASAKTASAKGAYEQDETAAKARYDVGPRGPRPRTV